MKIVSITEKEIHVTGVKFSPGAVSVYRYRPLK